MLVRFANDATLCERKLEVFNLAVVFVKGLDQYVAGLDVVLKVVEFLVIVIKLRLDSPSSADAV